MSNEEINIKAKELVDECKSLNYDLTDTENHKEYGNLAICHTIDTLNEILKSTYDSVVAQKLGQCILIKQAIENL